MERVGRPAHDTKPSRAARAAAKRSRFVVMVAVLVVAPFFIYPLFLMQALCFALFACAFNLLIGYVGCCRSATRSISAGRAIISAHAAKVWGLPPELAILTGTADRRRDSAWSPDRWRSAGRASTSR